MKYFFALLLGCCFHVVLGQAPVISTNSPKLVIGMVVDQMRFDYLSKFYNQFSEGGFKRLMRKGAFFKNHHINYVPTVTAAGHASIYTGSAPGVHGIIGNAWFHRETGSKIYCVDNDTVQPVGTTSPAGRKSPVHLQVSTISDELKLATQNRSKVISISLKDRAAILSGGHSADASYWFNPKRYGKWITSSFYRRELPEWVQDFNKKENIDTYIKDWELLYPVRSYSHAINSHELFENGYRGQKTASFPYLIDSLASKNQYYSILRATPEGNRMTLDFAKKAIVNESLGTDATTDFLMISFSSTDYIGHNFGVDSVALEDAYLRLDKDIAKFLKFIDTKVGAQNYFLFLTADHGAGSVSGFLKTKKIPAAYFKQASLRLALAAELQKKFSVLNPVRAITNQQIYLNTPAFTDKRIDLFVVRKYVAAWLLRRPDIEQVFTKEQMENNRISNNMAFKVKEGYHSKRSGDIIYVLPPNEVAYAKKGSAHGSGYQYDSHIPLLFYGANISPGVHYAPSDITDIATTLASIMGIAAPNGATGSILPVQNDK